jgi:cysteine synthase A
VVCNIYDNPFIAVMSEGNSPARGKMMEELGAEVVYVPQVEGLPGQVTGKDIQAAVKRAKEITAQRNGYYVDQFNNEGSVLAHEEGTGPEIWRNTGGKTDAFVAAIGSGGTFTGVSRYLKRMNPSVLCVAVEPLGAEILAGKDVVKPMHNIQGTGYNLIPPHWDSSLADYFIAVSDDETREFRDMLARKESIYVGYSAAANVCACIRFMNMMKVGESFNIVTVLCDSGLIY